jgi:hypothetical protein
VSDLTEAEILDRHQDALGIAHRSCQSLGRNAADDYLAPRGQDYGELKEALELLEGSARQMAHFRADARWLKLGILYAKVMRKAQASFIAQRWNDFNKLMPLFVTGKRHLQDLQMKTGTRGPILPQRPSDWLIMPDLPLMRPPPIRIH